MTTPTEFVTREEFNAAVTDVKARLSDVNRRVQGLFNLADRMGYSVTVPEGDSLPESTPDTDAPAVPGWNDNNATDAPVASGVDYVGAAYGLASIKRDANNLGAAVPATYFTEVVDWFVTCFAGDPSFDAAEFRRNAGV